VTRQPTIDVFRCDYCGELADTADARPYFDRVEKLDDGRWRNTVAVYCSTYCGRTATAPAGSGRG
jgi:hypothetical protein